MLLGAPAEAVQARRDRAHGRAARALRDRPRRRPPGRHLLRRHAPPAGPRRVPDACTAPSSSSTSRRPAWTPPAGPRCGARSRAWCSDGAALILTTQYLEEADRLADEIVVLSGGKTVAAGTPAQLKARVGDRRVHVSLPADGALASAARRVRAPRARARRRARRLSIPAPDGPRRPARGPRRARGPVDVEEASLSQPTLDDAFFALAGERDHAGRGAR